MGAKHRSQLLIVLILVLSDLAIADYRSEGLMDIEKEAHVVVGKFRNVGTFSIGGYYNGTWKKLTYSYPDPWEGTFLSIYIDGKVYSNSVNPTSINMERGNLMDVYAEKYPHIVDDKIYAEWRLPEDVVVEEIFELIENGTKLYISITNKGNRDITAGARLHIDTMLGENDGAPIYIPGDGLKSMESEYSGTDLDFEYWKAYNKEENATVITSGILYGEDITYPDKFLVTDWKKSMYSSWDYEVDPERSILGDSSVLIYYDPRILLPNETRVIATIYKKGDPVLSFSKGPLGIADIVSSELGENYVPGQNVTMSVDVVARDVENDTNVLVEVIDKGGNIIYIYNTTEDFTEPDTVNPVKFNLEIPKGFTTNDSFEIIASLFSGGKRVDNKTKRFSITKPSGVKNFWLEDARVGNLSADHVLPIEADIRSWGGENQGEVDLEILRGGKTIHGSMKSTGTVSPHRVKTVTFTWEVGNLTQEPMTLTFSLYRNFRKIDEITKEFSFNLSSNESFVPVSVGGEEVSTSNSHDIAILLLIPLITLFLFLNPLTRDRSIELFRSLHGMATGKGREGVEIKKTRDGDNIRLTVKNNGRRELRKCVLEDNLPKGVDVTISRPSVMGGGGRLIILKSDRFLWDIGKLPPKSTVVLEYQMQGGRVLLPARLKWDSGEKNTG
jgi:hypothetical protein